VRNPIKETIDREEYKVCRLLIHHRIWESHFWCISEERCQRDLLTSFSIAKMGLDFTLIFQHVLVTLINSEILDL